MRQQLFRKLGVILVRSGARFMEANAHGDHIFTKAPSDHPTEKLAYLMAHLPRALNECQRWKNYRSVPQSERETVLMHSWNATLLMMTMLALEDAHGIGARLDHARLIGASLLHDTGEGATGDVTFVVKNDPRVKEAMQAIEHEQVHAMFDGLWPEVSTALLSAYNVQDETTLDGRFFNAMEVMGYMLYAIPQMRLGRTEFIEVFVRQHLRIMEHAKEFVSIKMLYEPFHDEVVRTIALHERAKNMREQTAQKPEGVRLALKKLFRAA
jgi:5'-deoxynucleotidase YfbR-like HD superfamily hydrolase